MKVFGLIIVLAALSSPACVRNTESQNLQPTTQTPPAPTPNPAKPPISAEISRLTAQQLCDRISEIETMPTTDPTITDPIYESLIAKGIEAYPCLVDKIVETKKMPDPRYSVPHWQHFAIGDAAVFILVRSLSQESDEREKLLIEMLPPGSQKEWETNGIYAYFNYVSEPKNRKALQNWWKNWLKENKK